MHFSFSQRVVLFRRIVERDKQSLGLVGNNDHVTLHPTLISVHRKRLVEDGYRQLASQPPHALKGVIRVKFYNQQVRQLQSCM